MVSGYFRGSFVFPPVNIFLASSFKLLLIVERFYNDSGLEHLNVDHGILTEYGLLKLSFDRGLFIGQMMV
jgi:hypothetical protein